MLHSGQRHVACCGDYDETSFSHDSKISFCLHVSCHSGAESDLLTIAQTVSYSLWWTLGSLPFLLRDQNDSGRWLGFGLAQWQSRLHWRESEFSKFFLKSHESSVLCTTARIATRMSTCKQTSTQWVNSGREEKCSCATLKFLSPHQESQLFISNIQHIQ